MRVLQLKTRLLTLFMLHLDLSESKKNPSQTTEDSQITFSNQNPQNQNLDNYKNQTYYYYQPLPPISSSNIKKTKDKKVIDNLVKLYGKKRTKGQDIITNERSEEMEDNLGKYMGKFDSSENDKNLANKTISTTEKVNETTASDESEVNPGLLQFISLIFTNIFEATISKIFSIIESSL